MSQAPVIFSNERRSAAFSESATEGKPDFHLAGGKGTLRGSGRRVEIDRTWGIIWFLFFQVTDYCWSQSELFSISGAV